MMNKYAFIGAIAMSAVSASTYAGGILPSFMERAENSPVEFQLRAGYSSGGDKIGPAISDAYGQSQISAGSGFTVGMGVNYDLKTTYPMFLTANVHVIADHATSKESDVTFTRIPMDFMVGSQYRKFRFAGGITHHVNPTIQYRWDNDDEAFDKEESTSKSYGAATGQVVEASYLVKKVDLNLRYTNIEYDFAGVKVDGSGMAISVMYRF